MKLFAIVVLTSLIAISTGKNAEADSWSDRVALPEGETAVSLFDGSTLNGWQGLTKHWSIEDGVIVGKNDGVVPASTYLLTENSYRDFRLLMEVKQTLGPNYSTMHSAVCCLGEIVEDNGQAFGFRGPLLMFCHDWGIWDAHRRNRIYPAGHKGTYRPGAEKRGAWNQIEILVIGDRIRMVANGKMVIDMTDKAELLQTSPIGLQLHGNRRPQEFRFRGLVLAANPKDQLLTFNPEK